MIYINNNDDGLCKGIFDIGEIQNVLKKIYSKKQYPFILIEVSIYNEYTEEIINYIEMNGYLRVYI